MFRTKKSVDRHVQELFRKVKDENERTLRSYNIAKLYYQVEDYESARRYVSCYLEVKGDQAGPHKLLGNIYEALGQKESALSQYKQSLELEPRQDDLVLKVCELLADMDIEHDVNRVKYWVDRADEKFPHHPTVFRLKEKLLAVDRPAGGSEDLEALIAAELSARPSDVRLRVKLLKYYMDKSRLDDAYKHAVDVESTHVHRDSVAWYEALCDLLSKCKDGRQSKWSFWIVYVSSLERYAALSLKEQGHVLKKTVAEAAQAVFNFDQALTEARLQEYYKRATFAEHMFTHMWGQLHFHLACLLIRKTKREQGSWSDTGRLCAPMLLAAMHVQPIDATSAWASELKDQAKSQIQLWHREASYRCSQAAHVLRAYARDDLQKIIDKISQFCVGSWRERIYQRIFVSRAHIATSYFANHNAANPPLRLCSTTEIKIYDQVAESVWPASLHHHVWLGIVNARAHNNRNLHDDSGGPRPHQYCHVFPALQLSVYNLSQAAPDSLGQLDIDAFLNAAVLCASVVVEEQQRSGFMTPERLPIFPADITNTLCTCTQEKWWSSAYKIYRKQDDASSDLGEIRQELQRGLEVIRCIGNHGLHPAILVHLARIFHHRAKLLKEKDKNHSDLPFVEARCELYWTAVVPLLERLLNNQTIRTTSPKIFDYQGKEMNNVELTNALEEGRLLLAQRYIREKQYEQAIEALQALKCPEASFMQGEIYKSLADELMSTLPKENLTSAMRSQHIVMLSKARGCYYLTLDRLRSPGMNPKHPLNSELGTRIADIENDLKRIDPDVWRANRHECDIMSEESYSSAHSGEQPVVQSNYSAMHSNNIHVIGTPQKSSAHRTPKQTSTPCRIQHQDILELTRKSTQQEARPSPERLDAQIRQLIHSKDNMIQTILEQNKTLLESNKHLVESNKALLDSNKSLVESNKTMSEKIEELQRQFAMFFKDARERESRQVPPPRPASTSPGRNNLEEDLYVVGHDEDYPESQQSHQANPQSGQFQANLFLQQHQRNPYQSMVYPPAALQGYYPAMPFADPHGQQHLTSLYGGPRLFQMPTPYYPRPGLEPALLPAAPPKIPADNAQGIFANRLLNHLADLQPPQQQQQQQPALSMPQLSAQLQSFDLTRKEIPAKDRHRPPQPPTKQSLDPSPPPPVNVVITSSDTLPTAAATSLQPPLSVTIPPQYRATCSSSINTSASAISAAPPHSYQISMPSQATIPTTVNLPPLSTTITATIAEQEHHRTTRDKSDLSLVAGPAPDIEHDPLPDFLPLIPLPAEINVTTGEENEEAVYCARAKLYRWYDREWKERGLGNVKLLRNREGKIRLVMRREQVLKICANHMITSDMELTRMSNNDKAWIWAANDFADEEVRLEKLCIKFKTVEEARAFKRSFDEARKNLAESAETTTPKMVNDEGIAPKTIVGGFTFASEPITRNVAGREAATKEEIIPKASPFADFTFAKAAETRADKATPGGFDFVGAPAGLEPPAESTAVALRRPRAPPKTTDAEKLEVFGAINDDGEAVLYEKQTSLVRSGGGGDSTAWKNRGLGNVRILLDPKTGKIRLSIKREETNKTFCNYVVTAKTKFCLRSGADNAVTWLMREPTRGKTDNIGCVFENAEQAERFRNSLLALQTRMRNDRLPTSLVKLEGKTVRLREASVAEGGEKASLAEIFKAPIGSWECQSCYVRNSEENSYCLACDSPRDPAMPAKEKSPGFGLGGAPSEPKTGGFTFGVPKTADKSLAEMFKPRPGSWECRSCLLRNSETDYCAACEAPKDPSMPPKSNSLTTVKAPNFTFGIAQTSTKGDSATTGFTFKLRNRDEKNSSGETMITSGAPIFGGAKAAPPSGNFVFGIGQKASDVRENDETASGFAFGSPGKSFDFRFTSKSPVKSPGDPGSSKGGDASEDEVAESEDVYFAPVVPLPDKIEVRTGEEDEEIVYAHRAKLFRFDATEKEWKERGLGDIKILRNPASAKLRMVMRRDQTLKLCLNHAVTRELELKAKDEKTWLWNAADYSEGDIEYLQLACRFKTPEIANDFRNKLENAVETGSGETSNDDTTGSSTIEVLPSPDIQVVYEAKATDEDKAAALKLRLPENFYSYRLKDDCPGCRGCREPEVPVYTDESGKNGAGAAGQSPIVAKIAPPKFTPSAVFPPANTEPTANLQFGNSGNNDAMKFTNFSFGASTANGKTNIFGAATAANRPADKDASVGDNYGAENLKMCGPSGAVSREAPNFAELASENGDKAHIPNIQSVFGGTNFQGSIFGAGVNTGTSIFGGNATTPKNSGEAPKEVAEKASPLPNIFGGPTKAPSSTASPIFGANPFGAQNFGAAAGAASGANIFGGKSATHTFGNATTAGGNIFGAGDTDAGKLSFGALAAGDDNNSASNEEPAEKPAPDNKTPITADGDDKTGGGGGGGGGAVPNFMSLSSNLTFSALAAQQPGNTFKKDPNFSFAGAGATVFGGKTGGAPNSAATKSPATAKKNNAEDAGDEDDENNEEDADEHDPHFEPIIPLPDAIEVRTGEEDEDKIFAQRAKLFRFESETKEWKERGTGEMKLLHHSQHGTYRLLLRREQVHKVVCNQLVTADLELKPLSSSDRAWIWAAFNHAEEPYGLEELAVKFKTPELAVQFKDAVEKAKAQLQQRQAERPPETTTTTTTTGERYAEEQPHHHDDDVDEDDEEEEEEEEEEEDDDEEHSMIFASTVDLLALDGNTWKSLGNGILKILYDSEIYGAKIIVEADDTGEILSNTVISMETTMEMSQNSCIWTAIDEVPNPPMRRTLKAVFAYVELAQEMYMNFQDGQEYAKQADISEASYYDPSIE